MKNASCMLNVHRRFEGACLIILALDISPTMPTFLAICTYVLIFVHHLLCSTSSYSFYSDVLPQANPSIEKLFWCVKRWRSITTWVWSCWRTSLRATFTASSLPVMTTERLRSFARLISIATPVHRHLLKTIHTFTIGQVQTYTVYDTIRYIICTEKLTGKLLV